MTLADIQPLPITLANEHIVRPQYDRVRAFCQERNAVAMLRTVARLRAEDEALAALIDEFGRPSQTWLDKQVRTMLDNDRAYREHVPETSGPELTEEVARETAKADHTRILTDYLQSRPDVSRKLYFDFGAFPVTLEGLKFGIDVIRAVGDLNAVEATHGANARILVETDSEFWQNVTAAEVAAWVSRFCEGWQ